MYIGNPYFVEPNATHFTFGHLRRYRLIKVSVLAQNALLMIWAGGIPRVQAMEAAARRRSCICGTPAGSANLIRAQTRKAICPLLRGLPVPGCMNRGP